MSGELKLKPSERKLVIKLRELFARDSGRPQTIVIQKTGNRFHVGSVTSKGVIKE